MTAIGGETGEDAGGGTSTGDEPTTLTTSPTTSPSTSAATSVSATGPDETLGTSTGSSGASEPSTTRMTFTTDDSSDQTGTGAAFITPPDGGGVCFVSGGGNGDYLASCECDVWAQDCGRGYRCSPWANDGGDVWNATRCSQIDPSPGDVGDPCTVEGAVASGQDSCGGDSMCFNVDPETLEGTCVAFCSGDQQNPMCSPDSICVNSNEGALPLCHRVCDPLLQDCPDGEACYGVGEPENSDPLVCMREGVGVRALSGARSAMCPLGSTGVPPSFIAACADDEPCCAQWCSLSEPNSCDEGLECVPWYDENVIPGPFPQGVCVEA